MSTPSKNLALMFRILFSLSESRISRILGLHGLPRYPLPPLCPSYHLRPLPYLRFPNPRPLPYLRRLCHLRPLLCLPTQSAFIRVIRLIRDSDSFPRQHVRDVFRQLKVVFPLKVRNASVLETKHDDDVHTHILGGGQVCFGLFPFAQM